MENLWHANFTRMNLAWGYASISEEATIPHGPSAADRYPFNTSSHFSGDESPFLGDVSKKLKDETDAGYLLLTQSIRPIFSLRKN